jgi:hypothetical protein
LKNDIRLVVDPVINEASSINARVIANLDVRQANYKGLVQRIVYDETDRWKAEDLRLLNVGATATPFGVAREVIARLAPPG